jgi:hypothetical protein
LLSKAEIPLFLSREPAKRKTIIVQVLFLDDDRTHETVITGFNKIGWVTSSGLVVHARRRRIVATPISEIKRHHHEFRKTPENLDQSKLERFFAMNYRAYDLFFSGVAAIASRNKDFFLNPIKLPILDGIGREEHDKRWGALTVAITECDFLCVFDSKSLISRFIAYIDDGPWSHTASYSGEGTIFEAVPPRVCERPLEIYRDPRYRLGLYRTVPELDPAQKLSFNAFQRRQIGRRYSYEKAFLAGFLKHLRRPRNAPTPNDFAILPQVTLIAVV